MPVVVGVGDIHEVAWFVVLWIVVDVVDHVSGSQSAPVDLLPDSNVETGGLAAIAGNVVAGRDAVVAAAIELIPGRGARHRRSPGLRWHACTHPRPCTQIR